jgi:hypothetical protein
MKERPILFSSAIIQALPNKSQTRRTRNLNFINENPDRFSFTAFDVELGEGFAQFHDTQESKTFRIKSPYGITGDRLWVRETWAIADDSYGSQRFYYKADGIPRDLFDPEGFKWKPSIHMPKEVCRLRLEVTDIRVERLQDISEEDAISEGIESYKTDHEANSWKSNPWCWVVEFEKFEYS